MGVRMGDVAAREQECNTIHRIKTLLHASQPLTQTQNFSAQIRRKFLEGLMVFDRDYLDMPLSYRTDIQKGDNTIIAIDLVGGHITRGNAAKQALIARIDF